MAEIVRSPIDLDALIERVRSSAAGAILTFSGVVRDNQRERQVTGIDYHAYPEMAVRELEKIERAASERWPGLGILIVHRVGYLDVGEASVAIAVSSGHRPAGFEALRFAIEEIKRHVPIWKKEMYIDGYAWIEGS